MPRERSRRRKSRDGAGENGAARARSTWSGVISFGLVAVPVELFTGSRRSTLSLRMLTPDGMPLSRQYVCPEDGKVLSGDEIQRGYEVSEGEFVIVTDEELEQLAPRQSREIALERFVPREQIDPAWFVRSYFLVPGEEQQRAYRLLADTMERTGRAGIATFVMRGRAYAVAIFADQGILRAETLRFGDELRSPADLGLPEPADVPSKLVKEMTKAIESLSESSLDPAEMEDDRVERLRTLAEKKRKRGEDIVEAPAASEGGEADEDGRAGVIDLMAVLKERLAKASDGKPSGNGKRPRNDDTTDRSDLEGETKQELYERAKKLDISGRSRMTRKELIKSLRQAG
ncbi:MAG TPA: Ku protein [Gemmatimonadaceae bacterium]